MAHSNIKTVGSNELAVSLDAAKIHLRISDYEAIDADENALITDLINQATDYCENHTRRSFTTTTWEYKADALQNASNDDDWWDGVQEGALGQLFTAQPIVLPYVPIQSVVSVSFYSSNDTEIVVPLNTLLINESLGRIAPKSGVLWPTGLRSKDVVRVVYTRGYGNASTIPTSIKRAILLLVAHWYENREIVQGGENFTAFAIGETPHTVTAILDKYKVMRL